MVNNDERAVDAVLWIVVLASIFGVAAGFWFYRHQIATLPVYVWPFVMDSPFAGLLVALVSLFALKNVRNEWTNAISFVAGIASLKVGLWALAALGLFASSFFSAELALTSWFLVVTHVVQIAEGVFLLGVQKFRAWMLPLGFAWFLFNDWLDYGPSSLYPQLPPLQSVAQTTHALDLLSFIAVVLSLGLVVLFAWACRKPRAFEWPWIVVRRVQARFRGT